MDFTDGVGRVLHGLIEDASDDIVVRLDHSGFIIHASPNAIELGIDPGALLLLPHVADLADPEYSLELEAHVAAVLAGAGGDEWIEFPLATEHARSEDDATAVAPGQRSWYGLSLRVLDADTGGTRGAFGLLRPLRRSPAIEAELGSRAAIDPHTGLANRQAFCAFLARAINADTPHSVAIFAVDQMRAIFMQYGQATADEIRWGFAKFLETMTHGDQDLAQIDEERFGVILPGMGLRAARQWASDVLHTFAGLAASGSNRTRELTASAGLAHVEVSVDWTLRQAELGLVMARAGGGMQAGVCRRSSALACGAMVERAMEAAVERAERRRV